MTTARVLVVDDKENFTKLFRRLLPADRFDVTTAADGARALALIAAGDFDVVVTDIRMPGADGLEVLRAARAHDPDAEVVLMTAFASVPAAVDAIRQGAYDYLAKPFEPDEAVLVIERAVERRRLRQQARDLKRALDGIRRIDNLVARSPAMGPVLGLVQRASTSDATVLITGESGTGKEVVARAVHASGARAAARFVAVNCGAIPEALLESELFGHVRGSFTGAATDHRGLFEEADGGSIFLDEIAELPLAMQVKLNRALQERRVRRVGATAERAIDVRVIAATNVELRAAVAAGRFREDLFYRLNVLHLPLPPLRARPEDIPALAAVLLERHGARLATAPQGFTPEALTALVRYPWPGNVRELENAVERAIAVTDGPRIELEALPEEVSAVLRPRVTRGTEAQLSYREVVDLARDRASREYLIALMQELGGNVTEAARRAGVERESLHRLLKRYGVRSEDFKPRP
ncbi:MAG: sigma-54-dependent Fis family transcriptional regulator [Kofleriaceae bacterium]|nr:sigma-54-dependent Fis family transcriptional regulator [Kofleriaceae bacterium]MBP9169769.1 sigma-54-dependent Fis family transcriptional regulator [Kofleriaceae bacterium]MBP9862218.1 sigma-54-dependent Fis family transcriptional regulator [Kofleriaceae bacterium]